MSALSGGECLLLPPGQVNPMGLPNRPGVQEMSLSGIHSHSSALNNFMISKSTANIMKNSTGFHQNRIRRDQSYIVGPETYVEDYKNNLEIVKMVCISIHCTLGLSNFTNLYAIGLFTGKRQMFQDSLSNQ